jgi:hypothetical protein
VEEAGEERTVAGVCGGGVVRELERMCGYEEIVNVVR